MAERATLREVDRGPAGEGVASRIGERQIVRRRGRHVDGRRAAALESADIAHERPDVLVLVHVAEAGHRREREAVLDDPEELGVTFLLRD